MKYVYETESIIFSSLQKAKNFWLPDKVNDVTFETTNDLTRVKRVRNKGAMQENIDNSGWIYKKELH